MSEEPGRRLDRSKSLTSVGQQFADEIDEELAARGLSRADLARLLGVTPPHVTQTLRGNVTLRTVERFAQALGCEVYIILVTSDTSRREVE